MAIRFIEGFELNAASSTTNDQYLERKFATITGIPGSAAGHKVGLALTGESAILTTPEFADQDVWIINWAWNAASVAQTGQAARMTIRRAGVEQLRVAVRAYNGVNSDDRFVLDIQRGATTLATVGPFWAGQWYNFQLKVTIDPSAGAYELKVDDVSVASDTGVNTADAGVADADAFRWSCDNGTSNLSLDHIVIADDTGTDTNDFFGPVLVTSALPRADGDDLDWTPSEGSTHFSLVNEVMPNNNVVITEDPKRVTATTVGDVDRWLMDTLTTTWALPTATAVLAVGVETCAAMDASGSLDIAPVFKDATAATATGTPFTVDDTAYEVSVQIWEENPALAAAWTLADIDAGQFGVIVNA